MVKAVVVYHGSDLDGVSSAALAVLAYGKENVTLIPSDYDKNQVELNGKIKQSIIDISSSVDVVILDYSIDPRIMVDLESFKNVRKVRWYDHHKSAILRYIDFIEEPHDKYKMSDGSYGLSVLDGKKDYYCTTKICGAYIYYEMLKSCSKGKFKEFIESETLSAFYGYVTIFDTWMSSDEHFETACMLNLGCQKFISADGVFKLAELMEKPGFEENCLGLILEGKTIQDYVNKKNADWAKRAAFTAEFEGLKVCAINATPGGSFVAEPAATSEHDALMVFQYIKSREWAVSLYHNPKSVKKPDLSVIAKKYGGGGHPGACGFRTKDIFHFLYKIY